MGSTTLRVKGKTILVCHICQSPHATRPSPSRCHGDTCSNVVQDTDTDKNPRCEGGDVVVVVVTTTLVWVDKSNEATTLTYGKKNMANTSNKNTTKPNRLRALRSVLFHRCKLSRPKRKSIHTQTHIACCVAVTSFGPRIES